MILRFIFLLIFIIERALNQFNNGNRLNENTNINHSSNMIHFINCGQSDSILIESNGKCGLIVCSNPYNGPINVVESIQIDESIGEILWPDKNDNRVKALLNYLSYLKIDKLDFFIRTHSHLDHIGGIPAVAYNYVESNTKYYYRAYLETLEDRWKVSWSNYKYYLAAVKSMQTKKQN